MKYTTLISFLVVAWMYIQILLPSGSVFNLPIKHAATIFLFIPALIIYVYKYRVKQDFNISLFILSYMILFLWVFVGIEKHSNAKYAMSEYSFFAVYILVVGGFFVLCQNELVKERIYRAFLWIFVWYVCLRLALVSFIYLEIVSISDFLLFYKSVFGLNQSSFPMVPVGLWRINSANDIFLFLGAYYFVVNYKWLGGSSILKCLLLVAIVLACYVAFSRIGFIILVLAMSMRFILSKKIAVYFIVLVCASFLSVGYFSQKFEVGTSIVERFTGDATKESNDIKVNQIDAIGNTINSQPILGVGFGGSLMGNIRSEDSPFSYEAQIPSFFAKLGVLGFFIFILANFSLLMFLIKVNDIFRQRLMLSIGCLTSFSLFFGVSFVNLYYTGVVPSLVLAFILFCYKTPFDLASLK